MRAHHRLQEGHQVQQQRVALLPLLAQLQTMQTVQGAVEAAGGGPACPTGQKSGGVRPATVMVEQDGGA